MPDTARSQASLSQHMMRILARLQAMSAVNLYDIKLVEFLGQFYPDQIHCRENQHGNYQTEDSEIVLLCVALLSQAVQQGHVCLDLQVIGGRRFFDPQGEITQLPEGEELVTLFQQSPLCQQLETTRPLVLQGSLLYFHKYYHHEYQLAQILSQRLLQAEDEQTELSAERLDQLFPPQPDMDWQRAAALIALTRRFSIVTGGPGTGKTTTVVKILALLLARNTDLNIALAAPTGKAAARLQDSIRSAVDRLACEDSVREKLPTRVQTVHRLLGWLPDAQAFRFNANNRLDIDVLIVDEVSMVDMLLMNRLLQALPETARIIFLGDENQLASVEAGSVLAELVRGNSRFTPQMTRFLASQVDHLDVDAWQDEALSCLADSVIVLQKSHRFDADSALGQLAAAVNRGESDTAQSLLQNAEQSHVRACWGHEQLLFQQLLEEAGKQYAEYFTAVRRGAGPAELFSLFEQYQILCATRVGLYGAQALNHALEQKMSGGLAGDQVWYAGRPVMVTRNMPAQGLYNGDIGICVQKPSAQGEALQVCFPQSEGGFRYYVTQRLSDIETVYAMTIHKSQGSEFDTVAIMLGESSTGVSRELLYTGITRARQRVSLFSTEQGFEQAVQRRTHRYSGLRQQVEQLTAT